MPVDHLKQKSHHWRQKYTLRKLAGRPLLAHPLKSQEVEYLGYQSPGFS